MLRTVDDIVLNKSSHCYQQVSDKIFYDLTKHRFNCHYGQRKLLFAMWEFLNIAATKVRLCDSMFVYVGAAPGFNIQLVLELYPDLQTDLYDPRPIEVTETSLISVHTGKRGFFTDASIKEVLSKQKRLNKKHILFMNDMRLTTDDSSITRDMRLQASWCEGLRAFAACLKFRVCYTDTKLHYLSGKIYLQIYPPARSAEGRLICFSKGGKFLWKTYDILDYDKRMNAYNMCIRSAAVTFPQMTQTILNKMRDYPRSYESSVEFHIAQQYLRQQGLESVTNIVKLLRHINEAMYDRYHIKFAICVRKTRKAFVRKHSLRK